MPNHEDTFTDTPTHTIPIKESRNVIFEDVPETDLKSLFTMFSIVASAKGLGCIEEICIPVPQLKSNQVALDKYPYIELGLDAFPDADDFAIFKHTKEN